MRIPTRKIYGGHNVRDAPVAELGRKEGVPLYTCIVDLQKTFDSVYRSLLWVILGCRR